MSTSTTCAGIRVTVMGGALSCLLHPGRDDSGMGGSNPDVIVVNVTHIIIVTCHYSEL